MEQSIQSTPAQTIPEDRVLPVTRIVLALLIPFLILAFLILYFIPGETAQRFSWEIKPAVTAALMGSGYLGGAYLFLHAVFRPVWHRVAAGFPPVTVFATSMLVITILHWSRFDIRHFPFQLWLMLYIVAPILVPVLWLRNRSQDPKIPLRGERLVPSGIGFTLRFVGAGLGVSALVGYAFPEFLIRIFPWTLTPISGRVVAGWMLLLAAGGLTLSHETRWSAWRVPFESMILWFVLFLLRAFIHRGDMLNGNFLNWFTLIFALGLFGMLWVYFYMTALYRAVLPSES